MLDSKSRWHSWKWEGWFCCKRWPFSRCNCTKNHQLLNYYHSQQSRYLKNGKNCGTTVLAINFSQLILPLVFYQYIRSLSCRDAVIIQRLRVGHTRLTHSYLLSGTDQPECLACYCPLMVKHILIECLALPETLSILSRNPIFIALYNCYHIFYISFKPWS